MCVFVTYCYRINVEVVYIRTISKKIRERNGDKCLENILCHDGLDPHIRARLNCFRDFNSTLNPGVRISAKIVQKIDDTLELHVTRFTITIV